MSILSHSIFSLFAPCAIRFAHGFEAARRVRLLHSVGMPTKATETLLRRTAILGGLAAVPGLLRAVEEVSDVSFRYRADSIDALFQRAGKARTAKKMPAATHMAVLELLREEEVEIYRQAAAHPFKDITESNHWHRGRLKFPSMLEQELQRLRASKPGGPVPK